MLRWGEREESLGLHRHVLSRSLGWLIRGIWCLCQALLVAWATLAIYYSNLPWAWLRLALAAAFAAYAIWALWLSRQRRMSVVFIVLFLGLTFAAQPSVYRKGLLFMVPARHRARATVTWASTHWKAIF